MHDFQIGPNEAGQRFDKFLHKFLPVAQGSFLHKMLRKKNITLNGRKAEGKEMLEAGDKVTFFFSDETFHKFRGMTADGSPALPDRTGEYEKAYRKWKDIQIIYEDSHILILNKPAGILTQKAENDSLSINEWFIGYLLESRQTCRESLRLFKPSVCNRLDRNTSGLVLCGKSLAGTQELSRLIRERDIRKFYRTLVKGKMAKGSHITGYLEKKESSNKVTITPQKTGREAVPIETRYEPLKSLSDMTYLEVELITGKTHQIRAHLAAEGHPLLGDPKYGDGAWNEHYRKKWGIRYQLLHAFRLEFPDMDGVLKPLSRKVFTAPLPAVFDRCMEGQQMSEKTGGGKCPQ